MNARVTAQGITEKAPSIIKKGRALLRFINDDIGGRLLFPRQGKAGLAINVFTAARWREGVSRHERKNAPRKRAAL